MKSNPLHLLEKRYPRLKEQEFSYSADDLLSAVDTPAGKAEVLYLADRKDFEKCVIALAYRNDPEKTIPASMGASTIIGLANYEKYENGEENYHDTIVVLSALEYSAVPCESVGLEREDWIRKSVEIRKYHELTHYVSRKLYPENKNAIRDEVLADMNGIIAAFGHYDTEIARTVLGTEGATYREGARLQNYCDNPDEIMSAVNRLIDTFKENEKPDVFDNLKNIEENRIGWDITCT